MTKVEPRAQTSEPRATKNYTKGARPGLNQGTGNIFLTGCHIIMEHWLFCGPHFLLFWKGLSIHICPSILSVCLCVCVWERAGAGKLFFSIHKRTSGWEDTYLRNQTQGGLSAPGPEICNLFLFLILFLILFIFILFLKDFINIFIKRGKGREGEKYRCVVASLAPPTGDLVHNPGISPDGELNWWHFGSQPTLNPLSYTSHSLRSATLSLNLSLRHNKMRLAGTVERVEHILHV